MTSHRNAGKGSFAGPLASYGLTTVAVAFMIPLRRRAFRQFPDRLGFMDNEHTRYVPRTTSGYRCVNTPPA